MPFSCSECGWLIHKLFTKKIQHIKYNKLRYKTKLLYPGMTKVCSHIESNNINKISILNERYKTLIDIQALMITVIGYGRRI